MKNLLKYIAVFGALTLGVFLNVENVNGQCANYYSKGNATASMYNNTVTIRTDQKPEEFATISNIVAGETYTVTFSRSPGFITVRRGGTYNGTTVEAFGSGPITFTASTSGIYYVHFNPDSGCGTSGSGSYTTTITCTSCPPTPQDCEGATMVCSNTSFSGNSSGYGTQELNNTNKGCLNSYEKQSSWYYVNIGESGTLEMTISPNNGTDDYDWAIWGPFTETTANQNCPPITHPTRCSYADTYSGSTTGMGTSATETSEDQNGDGWVAPLNVTAGQVYIMVIDNFSISSDPFNLQWGGSAELACVEVSLPVGLTSFTGENKKTVNQLDWETETETNNDYFIIEHSSDGFSWQEIDKVSGAGNSTEVKTYSLEHRNFPSVINYYRLTQVDFDGKREVFPIISIDNLKNRKLIKRVNTLGQEVSASYKGIVIEYYDDNSVEKKIY